MELVSRLKAADEAFALATVVRTVSVTAAKAGAKAVIRPDGTIVAGWIGGGCAKGRGAEGRARRRSPTANPDWSRCNPRICSKSFGVKPGENRDGIRFARNMCPSQGTDGHLRRAGAAASLAGDLRRQPGRDVAADAGAAARLSRHARRARGDVAAARADMLVDGFALGELAGPPLSSSSPPRARATRPHSRRIATEAEYRAFVGSRRKMAALREKLVGQGVEAAAIDRVKAPAGLDLGAITPEEIAMSILAEITVERRRGQRSKPNG
jgi:xanthine dehydrogenase accessory factor